MSRNPANVLLYCAPACGNCWDSVDPATYTVPFGVTVIAWP